RHSHVPGERRDQAVRRGLRQRGRDAAQGGHYSYCDDRRRQGDVQDRRDARFERPRRPARRLWLYDDDSAQGSAAGQVRAEGRSEVAARPDAAGRPRGADRGWASAVTTVDFRFQSSDFRLITGFRVFVISWLILVAQTPAVLGQGAAPRIVDKGDRSQIMSAREVVVRTAAEWDALWRSHLPTRQPAAVDFSKEMVVGVFLGSRPTPGYGLTIVSAGEEGNALRVRY